MNGKDKKPRTLADLKPGQRGVVAQVGGEGALHRHLLDMGITPGVSVLLQKAAPMGDPLEFHLRGYSLSLRVEDARKITLGENGAGGEERGTMGALPQTPPRG